MTSRDDVALYADAAGQLGDDPGRGHRAARQEGALPDRGRGPHRLRVLEAVHAVRAGLVPAPFMRLGGGGGRGHAYKTSWYSFQGQGTDPGFSTPVIHGKYPVSVCLPPEGQNSCHPRPALIPLSVRGNKTTCQSDNSEKAFPAIFSRLTSLSKQAKREKSVILNSVV